MNKTCETCETCRHWSPWDGGYDGLEGAGFGECGAIKDIGPPYEAADPARAYRRTALALVVDMERCAAELVTKAEFGCVLHDPPPGPCP